MRRQNVFLLGTAPLAMLALSACDFFLGFGNFGRLDLRITDAPSDAAAAVVVAIDRITLQRDNGDDEVFRFSPPRQVDLAQLSNGAAVRLLSDESLPDGRYRALRLQLRADPASLDSYVRLDDGRVFPLHVPPGEEHRLELLTDFSIDDTGRTQLTLDVDLRAALREPDADEPGAYRLLPGLRLIDDERAGEISGHIASARIVTGCSPAVYVYRGHGVDAGDLGGSGAVPLSSALPFFDGSSDPAYKLAFLPAGDYTVAFTCAAADDDPDADDAVSFVEKETAVRAGSTTRIDF